MSENIIEFISEISRQIRLTASRELRPELTTEYFIIETDAENVLKISAEMFTERINGDGACSWTSENNMVNIGRLLHHNNNWWTNIK